MRAGRPAHGTGAKTHAWSWLRPAVKPSWLGRRRQREWLRPWLMLAGYALVVLGPLLVLTISTGRELAAGHVDWLRLAVPTGRRLVLLRNSLALSLGIGVLAAVGGWLGAVLLWTRWRSWGKLIIWLLLPLAALPPYLHALGWVTVFQRLSPLLQDLGCSTVFVRGWGGTLWVGVAAHTPLALGCAWLGLRSIDPELIEAARMARADVQALIRVILPLTSPSLLTGAGIVFLLNLLDHSVPAMLDVRVYAMEVFAEFSASNTPQRAFLAAAPLLFIGVSVISVLLENLRTLAVRSALHRPAWSNPPCWPAGVRVLLWVTGLLLATQALSPFAVMFARAGVGRGWLLTLQQAREEILYSFGTAGLAALLTLPLAILAARALLHPAAGRAVRWLVVMAPLAVPSSLVGVGLIVLASHPPLRSPILSGLMPPLASVTRFAPLGVVILVAQLRRTDTLLYDAALVFQPARWRRVVQIVAPLLAPGLLAGVGFVFALSSGELGATLMVIPPGRATLTMRIYNYLHYGASDSVAGLCLVLGGGALVAAGIGAGAAALWSRFLGGRQEAR